VTLGNARKGFTQSQEGNEEQLQTSADNLNPKSNLGRRAYLMRLRAKNCESVCEGLQNGGSVCSR